MIFGDMFSFPGLDGNYTEYDCKLDNNSGNWQDCQSSYSYGFTRFKENGVDGMELGDEFYPCSIQCPVEYGASNVYDQANGQRSLTPYDDVFNNKSELEKDGTLSSMCENNREGSEMNRSVTTRKPSDSAVPAFIRLGATVRERSRMHVLNEAFDELRKVIPRANLAEHQKLSKIATLRQAIQYIEALVRTLQSTGVEIRKSEGYCVGDMRGKRRTCRKRSV